MRTQYKNYYNIFVCFFFWIFEGIDLPDEILLFSVDYRHDKVIESISTNLIFVLVFLFACECLNVFFYFVQFHPRDLRSVPVKSI